jgi:hypothetical protein
LETSGRIGREFLETLGRMERGALTGMGVRVSACVFAWVHNEAGALPHLNTPDMILERRSQVLECAWPQTR